MGKLAFDMKHDPGNSVAERCEPMSLTGGWWVGKGLFSFMFEGEKKGG